MQQDLPLIDINAGFGFRAAERPDFPTADDLLRHMDWLGISAAVVYHNGARDTHPNFGNAALLDSIQSSPAAAERLIPAFTIGPAMLYEHDGMAQLTRAVQSRQVRALRLFPVSGRYRFPLVFPILEPVAEHQPALICDAREVPALHEVTTLAERFPDCPVIVTQCMWPHLPELLELMRRCSNVCADISWMHSNSTIELICHRFGSERLLFGLGRRSHQGAAIANLAHAQIDDEARARIAHGNAERLLGLPPVRPIPSRLADDPTKPFWKRFLAGQPIGTPVIDAHGHFGPTGLWMLQTHDPAEQVAQALRDMDRCSVETLIVSGLEALFSDPVTGNDRLRQTIDGHGDRFRGWIVFNPLYAREQMPHLDRWLRDPLFVGFKLLCSYWRVKLSDPRFDPMWEIANRYHLPILMHTWSDGFSNPSMLKEIAGRYPNASFVLGHSGGVDAGRGEAEELAIANPNVFLEWCGSFCSSIPWEQTIARVGTDRVLFGSDAVVHSFAYELGGLLSLPLADEAVRPILADNMRRILSRRQYS